MTDLEGLNSNKDTKRDLEAEIDTLHELDTLRMESGRLRDEGIKVLTAILEFSIDKKFLDDLKKGLFSEQLCQELKNHGTSLSQKTIIETLEPNKRWQIIDGPQRYLVEEAGQSLNVYKDYDPLDLEFPSISTVSPVPYVDR